MSGEAGEEWSLQGEEEEEGGDPLLDSVLADVAECCQHLQGEAAPSLEEILAEQPEDWGELATVAVAAGEEAGAGNTTPRRNPVIANLALPPGGIAADISDTLSVRSWDSKAGRGGGAGGSRRENGRAGVGGGPVRHVVLRAVSSQLVSAVQRVQAGQPTCLAATHLIAIGTQHGLVLVFDSSQVLKWLLGGAELGRDYGAVSCLAISSDSTRLLVGFARGQLVEWDLTQGKLIRDLPEVHPSGSAVTMVSFTIFNQSAVQLYSKSIQSN